MRLGDLVQQLSFGTDAEGELFAFQMDLYKVFRVKRKEDNANGDVISEYIFVEVSDYAFKKMISDADIKYYRDFQTKLLSETFFGHKSDLRWNLYLILIVESYEQYSDSGMLQLIENDADYARKFIMTANDAIEWLDKTWLKTVSEEQNVYVDPVQEWHSELSNVGLPGCLTETFAQAHVQLFLDGQAIMPSENIATQRRNRRNANYDEVIESIRTVTLNDFRDHCFEGSEALHPSQVNLLHGPNGSGKTSVMEAIELALTNEINRCSEFGDERAHSLLSLEVICSTESGESLQFQPGKPTSFYKKLAQKWYGVPAGRQLSELNNFFHRYNFFDSEAAYRFALNESSQGEKGKFDYSDNLSRLVYGDEVIDKQKKWARYLQEFNARAEDLTKQRQNALMQLDALKQQLSEVRQYDDVHFDDLDRQLSAVRLKSSRKHRNSNESTSDYISRLSLLFSSIEVQRQQLEDAHINVDILSLKNIDMQQMQIKDSIKHNIQRKRSIEATISKWETEISGLIQQLLQIEPLLISTNNVYEIIKDTWEQWLRVKKTIEQPKQVMLRKNLDLREEMISKNIEWIDQLNAKYPMLENMTEKDLLILSVEDYSALLIEYREKNATLSILNKQLTATEQLTGQIEAVLSRIHAAGEEYLTSNEDSTHCPLCAENYGTHQALGNAIKQARSLKSINGEQLAELLKEIHSLEYDTKKAWEELSLHEKNSRHIELINKAYGELLMSSFYRNNLELSLNEMFDEYRMVIASKSDLMNEKSQIQGQIRVFDDFGMSRHLILLGEHFCQENTLYKEYRAKDHPNTFEEFLIEKEASQLTEISKLKEIKEALETQRNSLNDLIKQQSLDAVDDSIKDLERKLQDIIKIHESVKILLDDFDLSDEENLLVWSGQLQKVQVYIELLVKYQENLRENARLKADLNEKTLVLSKIDNRLNRCKEAVKAMEKLKPLREYTAGFIKRNIFQIERFFNLLHTPREFDQLELVEDGLSLRRKWDGKSVKAYQMSSGQRASLALSVMFAIHLAAPNAPRVLMMDEPVANMDDLHLMNLLDLLRDLSLSGRQIFFTTANPDVANLFRRKFSFYRERFTHFEFMRPSGEPVHIESIHYSPYLEPSVIKLG